MQILATHGVLGFSDEAWIASGRIVDQLQTTMRAVDRHDVPRDDAGHSVQQADALQSVAQQLLLLDRTEDAAEYFDRCVKCVPLQSRPDQQARASLVAGLQGLHRNHLRTAWNCLQRTLDAKQAPMPIAVSAHAALAALYFGLGMRRPAQASAERGIALLGPDLETHDMPHAVLRALQVEFVVLDLIRQHERLHDLAFWPRHAEVAGSRIGVTQARTLVQACRREVEGYGFLCARLDFLDGLIGVAYEHSNADGRMMSHIQGLNEQGLGAHAHAARHELALACIAGRQPEPLRQLMLCYSVTGRKTSGVEHHLDHDYCMAKLGELSGRDEAYISHYRDYAAQALLRLRQTCAYITVPATLRQAVTDVPKDDIASRLPGRYRRAYQFILAHLHEEHLSVREVADAIGVTERALQLAFRAALGLSPSALIRQCRMERIRDDLSSGAVGHGTTMLDVGRRWGLRSRSALLQSYKAAFGELPSQTPSVLLN